MATYTSEQNVETPNGGELEIIFEVEASGGAAATHWDPADPIETEICEAWINGQTKAISSERLQKLLDGKGEFALSFQKAAELAEEAAYDEDRECRDIDAEDHPSDYGDEW